MQQHKKIVIAPDSFKGSISAKDAAQAIRAGLLHGLDKSITADIVCVPIADGGEGTLDTLVSPEKRTRCQVKGPRFTSLHAEYGQLEDTAIIEMASAAGLTLIPESERSAGLTTTFGVGELILHALQSGYKKCILTVGGSATNDGGAGMLSALGGRFYDTDSNPFVPTGLTLDKIASIDLSELTPLLSDCEFLIAIDVKNPLLGQEGATYVYGRQKGATDAELDAIERGMSHYAALLSALSGKDVAAIKGGGAGGGLSAPLLAFANAKIQSGIEAVLDTLHFSDLLQGADLVITGEGKIDRQSLFGKAISGVATYAGKQNAPVYCFVGCIGDDIEVLKSMGVRDIFAIGDLAQSPEDSMQNAGRYLEQLAQHFAKTII